MKSWVGDLAQQLKTGLDSQYSNWMHDSETGHLLTILLGMWLSSRSLA